MRTAAEEWLGAAEDDLETVKEIVERVRTRFIDPAQKFFS